jgi:hypothetical protein
LECNYNKIIIRNQNLYIDGYCSETNTIYKYYEDNNYDDPEKYELTYYNVLRNDWG